MSEQNDIFFNFGDLVRVDGSWPRVFKVDGYRREHWQYPDEEWTDVVYELHDVGNMEFIEADMADLTLVETADKADDYLAVNPPNYEAPAPSMPDWVTFTLEGREIAMSKAKEPLKPTAREISAKEAEERKATRKARGEEIDNLLDLRIWAADMLAKTNNEEYGDRVFAIDAKLKELVDVD
jgi:acyl-CoA reductase-like NAD-dependent aldehyde dehydrogenase